jgi:hypothetical protein
MTSLINACNFFAKNVSYLTLRYPKNNLKLCNRQLHTKAKINSFNSFRTQVTKKKLVPKSKILLGLFGGVAGMGASVYCSNKCGFDSECVSRILDELLRRFLVANCQERATNRLKYYSKTDAKTDKSETVADDQFDWLEFFKMLYKEKFYFLVAVVVSIRSLVFKKAASAWISICRARLLSPFSILTYRENWEI